MTTSSEQKTKRTPSALFIDRLRKASSLGEIVDLLNEEDYHVLMPTGQRYTLDIAHLAGEEIVRRHITWLPATSAQVIEAYEQSQSGKVFIERTVAVPGHPDWSITYRNPDFVRGFAGIEF